MNKSAGALLSVGLSLALCACNGLIDDAEPSSNRIPMAPGLVPENAVDDVGMSDFRRLSPRELAASIEHLVGFRPATIDSLPFEARPAGFDRVDNQYRTASEHIGAYRAIADEIGARWSAEGVGGVAGCEGAASEVEDPSTCLEALIDRFAFPTLRREVSEEDRARLRERYEAGHDHASGLVSLAHALFRNPEFLYVIELPHLGGDDEPEELNAFELATRLSLAFCERTPDAELLALATDASLLEEATLESQALRLVDECGGATVESFVGQWLGFEQTRLASPGDRASIPEFDQDFIDGMDDEWRAYVDAVVFEESGSFGEFLSADYTVADERLAAVYDFAELGETPTRVSFPPQRRGVFNLPAFLAMFHHGDETHPIERGVHLLRRVACWGVPPADNVTFPPSDPELTGRARWDEHTLTPQCSACHATINPAGFAFEDFDSIGRHRTSEDGHPIDASGSIELLEISSVDGGASLSEALATSPLVAQCVAGQWFRYGMGRSETDLDATSIQHIASHLSQDIPMRQALASLATSYAFRLRRPTTD